MDFVTIHPLDNVRVSLEDGQKYALKNIGNGEAVIKYGFPIGTASENIPAGGLVHSHNLKTGLSGELAYTYHPNIIRHGKKTAPGISAYTRKNGKIGIRNDIWIINTVGCVNKTAEILSRETGAFFFAHPYGCSQLGEDFDTTQKILRGLILHPNAGGILVLGLGCENNNIGELKKILGDYDTERVRFLNVQDCENEIEEGKHIIEQLQKLASLDKRREVSAARLIIGLKCGGSDGLSGITANPLVGQIADEFTAMGAAAVLTEIPEMFGAEHLLMDRCVNRGVFEKTVHLINAYKRYFTNHSQPISENPSPGNKEGGITTLEEKSLGCTQKGGTAPVTAVLDYGDFVTQPGLNLLNGPGNDMVAVTNLTAAGCHLILFTTGRGTPLGAPVPTIKISTNSPLMARKPHWIDFDAGKSLAEKDSKEKLMDLIIDIANGKPAKNERNGFREIAIFKDGVTL